MSLSDLIIHGSASQLAEALLQVENVNYLDDYGYTPLIQTAIMDDIEKGRLLLEKGADVNQQDIIGNTALHWTVDNTNLDFSKLLLEHSANPNAYTTAGQPVLARALLNHHRELKSLLIQHGASIKFAQDFINTKLLGHRFELIGSADILIPDGRFTEVQYEGFYLETTVALIRDSLIQYRHNFAARPMRALFNIIETIINALTLGAELIKFQQYNIDTKRHSNRINELLKQQPIVLPISQEGHALSLIKFGNILAKCDRAKSDDFTDNVAIYRIGSPQHWSAKLLQGLIYERNSLEFINQDLSQLLQLEPMTTLNVPAQVIGNCSWANIEASIPALLFVLAFHEDNNDSEIPNHKANALALFHEWRRWDQERALNWCVRSFYEADQKRRASKAAILGAILFQRCHADNPGDLERARQIIPALRTEGYEYILQSYIELYCNHRNTEAGKSFTRLIQLCDDSYYDW